MSSGIEYATSLALSEAGLRVALGARRTDRLKELESQIINRNSHREVFIQKLDVSNNSDCNSFVNAVAEKWGKIDILINNAGLMPLSYFKNGKVIEWDRMIDVNIKESFTVPLR